jgi:hypothetical protein
VYFSVVVFLLFFFNEQDIRDEKQIIDMQTISKIYRMKYDFLSSWSILILYFVLFLQICPLVICTPPLTNNTFRWLGAPLVFFSYVL